MICQCIDDLSEKQTPENRGSQTESVPRYASCTNSHLRRQIQRGGPRNNCDFARWNSRVPVTVSLRVAVSPVTPVGSLQPGGREFRCVFNIMFHVSSSFSAAYHRGFKKLIPSDTSTSYSTLYIIRIIDFRRLRQLLLAQLVTY